MPTVNRMACPNRADGVHVLTGWEACSCGYTLTVPRFGFSLDVHDNQTHKELSEGFMSDNADVIAAALERVADRLRDTGGLK